MTVDLAERVTARRLVPSPRSPTPTACSRSSTPAGRRIATTTCFASSFATSAFKKTVGFVPAVAGAHGAGSPDGPQLRAATELYLAANCPDEALKSLAEGGEATMDDCRSSTLSSWLDRLPAESARGNPWAHLLEGQICMRDGRHDAALALFGQAETDFTAANDDWGMHQTLSLTECALYWKGNEKESALCCERALQYARTDDQVLHTLISLGFIMVNACAWPQVDALWSRISQIRRQPPHERSRLLSQEVRAALTKGDFRTAMDKGRDVLHYLVANATAAMQVPFLNTLALAEIDCGEYRAAKDHLSDCFDGCRRYGFAHIGKMAKDTLGVALVATGDFDAGVELIEEAAHDPSFGEDLYTLPAHLCHLGTAWRRRGDLEKAACYLQRALSCPGIEAFPSIYLNCLANAEFALARMRGRSTRSLELAGADARELGLHFIDLKIQFFCAVLAHLQRRDPAAAQSLSAIVPAQHRLGHVSFLSHELAMNIDLVKATLMQDDPSVEDAVIDALVRHARAPDILAPLLTVSERVASKCLSAARIHHDEVALRGLLDTARLSRYPAVRRLAAGKHRGRSPRDSGVPGFPELTPSRARSARTHRRRHDKPRACARSLPLAGHGQDARQSHLQRSWV